MAHHYRSRHRRAQTEWDPLRPPSPDFSIINVDPDDNSHYVPGSYPATAPSSSSIRSFLPRLWDALASPGRGLLSMTPASAESSPESSRTGSPSASPRHLPAQSWYVPPTGRRSPVYWTASTSKKGKTKPARPEPLGRINYLELAPLDGEEGELIDDEACFINVHPVSGIDILSLLPPELALHILSLISAPPISSSTPSNPYVKSPVSPARSSGLVTSSATGITARPSDADSDPHTALSSLLACRLVSRSWCRLANDNSVWRALFLARWIVDLRRSSSSQASPYPNFASPRPTLGKTWDYDPMLEIGSNPSAKALRVLGLSSPASYPTPLSPDPPPVTSAPLRLDWRILYWERLELDRRWAGTARVRVSSSSLGDDDLETRRRMGGVFDRVGVLPPSTPTSPMSLAAYNGVVTKPFQPKHMQLSGHTDSVYCLEFDSRRIITGSRDRTIKVWSLKTGQLLGTFQGHEGSVLCLKFEKDWDRDWASDDDDESDSEHTNEHHGETSDAERTQAASTSASRSSSPQSKSRRTKTRKVGQQRTGFMVSGSSDCKICVWDLRLGALIENDDRDDVSTLSSSDHYPGYTPQQQRSSTYGVRGRAARDEGERMVEAEVRDVLKGHTGGVLDIRIDKKWIVSCSKDTVIRVWNRHTLELHRTLRGHEGPVNAVGLQSGRVVSASGDGKMILWDIKSGERLRTFEGHDRGLACIEFKGDLIVSGSNDCKIKLWSASSGECIRTLVGHEALVRALSFDLRSARLVSASYDKSVKVWCLATGRMVREFKGEMSHSSHIFDVKFDVGRLVSTSHDQKIVVLDFTEGLNSGIFI